MSFTISLIKAENIVGDKLLPCATPDRQSNHFVVLSLIFIVAFVFKLVHGFYRPIYVVKGLFEDDVDCVYVCVILDDDVKSKYMFFARTIISEAVLFISKIILPQMTSKSFVNEGTVDFANVQKQTYSPIVYMHSFV